MNPDQNSPISFIPSWMVGGTECDWPEDAPYENGNYFNECLTCKSGFIGHKRRHTCRKCHYEAKARYDAMTPDEQAAQDAKVAVAIKDFWANTENPAPAPDRPVLIERVTAQPMT